RHEWRGAAPGGRPGREARAGGGIADRRAGRDEKAGFVDRALEALSRAEAEETDAWRLGGVLLDGGAAAVWVGTGDYPVGLFGEAAVRLLADDRLRRLRA